MYEDTPLKAYRIGISKNPPSCLEHSLGSPWGIHRICERIGDGEPIGMVFESRKPIAHHAILSHADFQFITTRILRLEGLEAGINQGKNAEGQCCDTLERHVYIHGTPFGDKIGSSFTRGCFVLEDSAMLELYDQLQPGCLVYIERQICVTK